MLNLLIIPYCTIAYGIHGGELVTGIDRQVRNAICALPFGLVTYTLLSTHYDYPAALLAFILAFVGVNMGFDNPKHPLWLKGLITLFPIGAILLPLAYFLGGKTKNPPFYSEFISGAFYGLILAGVSYVR